MFIDKSEKIRSDYNEKTYFYFRILIFMKKLKGIKFTNGLCNPKIWIVFLVISWQSNSQHNNDTIKKTESKEEYIETYLDIINIRVGINDAQSSFKIKDKASDLKITLQPNQKIKSVFTVLYRFVEFDFSYTPKFLKFNNDNDKNGSSKIFNIGTRFYLKNWMTNVQYSYTHGYYVDSKDIGRPDLPNFIFPEYRVYKFSGITSYVMNPNFSFKSLVKQTESQIKSVGSFVPTINYSLTKITNETPSHDLILDISIGPSYFYNLILNKKFVFSGGAHGGIGYSWNETRYSDGTPNAINDGIAYRTDFSFLAGYHSKKVYVGAKTIFDSYYHKAGSGIDLNDSQQFFEFYFGVRFDPPKKVDENFRKIQEKIRL